MPSFRASTTSRQKRVSRNFRGWGFAAGRDTVTGPATAVTVPARFRLSARVPVVVAPTSPAIPTSSKSLGPFLIGLSSVRDRRRDRCSTDASSPVPDGGDREGIELWRGKDSRSHATKFPLHMFRNILIPLKLRRMTRPRSAQNGTPPAIVTPLPLSQGI